MITVSTKNDYEEDDEDSDAEDLAEGDEDESDLDLAWKMVDIANCESYCSKAHWRYNGGSGHIISLGRCCIGKRVLCRRCEKYSWGGCGDHLNRVYRNIEEGQHCMCRSWPGVAIPSQRIIPTATEQTKQVESSIPAQGNGNPQILEAVANGGLK